MPTGDSRCGVCGYWHEPGGDHIGLVEEPMRFPSRAEREAIHEMQQSEVRARAQWGRQRLIEQAVRDVAKVDQLPLRTWDALFIAHIAGVSLDACGTCGPFLRRIRARFRELANGR